MLPSDFLSGVCAGMYRHLQARLRSNAESIAFYGGIEKEGKIIIHRFKELLRHHSRLLTKQWQFGMVQVSSCCTPHLALWTRPSASTVDLQCSSQGSRLVQ